MSHSTNAHQSPPTRTDHPPSPTLLSIVQNGSPSLLPATPASNSACTQPNHNEQAVEVSASGSPWRSSQTCTICADVPSDPYDVAVLPACGHAFCISCIASWVQVKPQCPNCKAPFCALFARRNLITGLSIEGPCAPCGTPPHARLPIDALLAQPWVSALLTPLHSAKYDIENSFQFPPLTAVVPDSSQIAQQQQQQQQNTATVYGDESFEDELEDQFWREEEQMHQSLMRSNLSRTVVSNRRFGDGGYVSSGRLRATPTRRANAAAQRAAAGSSSAGSKNSTPQSSKKKKKKKGSHHQQQRRLELEQQRQQQQQQQQGSNASQEITEPASEPGPSTSGDASSTSSAPTQAQLSGQTHLTADKMSSGRKKKVKKKSRAGIAAANAAAAQKEQQPSDDAVTTASSGSTSNTIPATSQLTECGNTTTA